MSDKNGALLSQAPPFSKTKVNTQGSRWRDGEQYEDGVIDEFLAFNAELLDEFMRIADNTIACIIRPLSSVEKSPVLPDSNDYTLSARVKTKGTLLEKLRRMQTTPLMNIQDVAGYRFDCDLSLSEQLSYAHAFRTDLLDSGANRVDIRDLREDPHSGYRAIHLHIRAKAGRGEMQIRTALQAKWANIYEEAADILGREIRYLHEGASMPPGAEDFVKKLLEASSMVRRVEETADARSYARSAEIKTLYRDVYGMLDDIHTDLRSLRLGKN